MLTSQSGTPFFAFRNVVGVFAVYKCLKIVLCGIGNDLHYHVGNTFVKECVSIKIYVLKALEPYMPQWVRFEREGFLMLPG